MTTETVAQMPPETVLRLTPADPEAKLLVLSEGNGSVSQDPLFESETVESDSTPSPETEGHLPKEEVHSVEETFTKERTLSDIVIREDAIWGSLTEAQRDWLRTEQQALEIDAYDRGAQKYKDFVAESAKRDGRASLTPERRLVCECMKTFVPAVKKLQEAAVKGKAMKGIVKWGVPILSLDAEKIALITLTVAVNQSHVPGNTYTMACDTVSRAIKMEREFAILKKSAPDVLQSLGRKAKKWDARAFRRLKLKALAADAAWDKDVRFHLGSILLFTLVESTQHFEHAMEYHTGRTVGVLRLREESRRLLETQHSEMEVLRPSLYPSVVPPVRWTEQEVGGYSYYKRAMMKSGDGHHEQQTQDAPIVRAALDILALTPWQIDPEILRVSDDLWKKGGDVPGLPASDPRPIPAPYQGYGGAKDDSPEAVEYRKAVVPIFRKNAEEISQRKLWLDRQRDSKVVRKYPGLYFPHQLDWRTRAYPIVATLNAQADDHGRGLLRFAEGKRLGDHGLEALTLHLANCIGFDKLPFPQRIANVHNMANQLDAWVSDPVGTCRGGWGDVDSPWKTLAAAREWVLATSTRNPRDFVSHVRCEVDGSCNGLQHLSAMGLDPIGGRAVNLIPSDIPQDIYSQVRAVVEAQVSADVASNSTDLNHPCHWWSGRVTRDVVKRSVMTTPYGVTLAGIRGQFHSDGHVEGAADSITLTSPGSNRVFTGASAASIYLSKVVHDAVGEVVVAAREIMDWLQEVATFTAEQNKAIRWPTPAGITVTQEYLATIVKRIVTLHQEITLREPHPDRLIEVRKQVRGLPPNFVHSFDAAHMFLATVAAYREGVTSMGHVHDSFSTHACDMPILNRVLRETFVGIYSKDVLREFKDFVEADTGVQLTNPPARGTLDISKLIDSPYAFH